MRRGWDEFGVMLITIVCLIALGHSCYTLQKRVKELETKLMECKP